ncbi:hypothetical protein AGR2A_Cc120110 [Agrobacterium genomosp. 2 str. CFBP 5494]|uniref:Uncharacterized protein n=1 Tax=Agrobacterium genomosp. 2 str. CFBP 5494 TaxID=1183436 RepID=A0A9W5AYV6_9HYPH|nr:hypothetical protein AGR2A_Cc120110 [Agrobacterium genomosp. 2 str. CFBP 5494]
MRLLCSSLTSIMFTICSHYWPLVSTLRQAVSAIPTFLGKQGRITWQRAWGPARLRKAHHAPAVKAFSLRQPGDRCVGMDIKIARALIRPGGRVHSGVGALVRRCERR